MICKEFTWKKCGPRGSSALEFVLTAGTIYDARTEADKWLLFDSDPRAIAFVGKCSSMNFARRLIMRVVHDAVRTEMYRMVRGACMNFDEHDLIDSINDAIEYHGDYVNARKDARKLLSAGSSLEAQDVARFILRITKRPSAIKAIIRSFRFWRER